MAQVVNFEIDNPGILQRRVHGAFQAFIADCLAFTPVGVALHFVAPDGLAGGLGRFLVITDICSRVTGIGRAQLHGRGGNLCTWTEQPIKLQANGEPYMYVTVGWSVTEEELLGVALDALSEAKSPDIAFLSFAG